MKQKSRKSAHRRLSLLLAVCTVLSVFSLCALADSQSMTVTGIAAYTYRSSLNDWYAVINVDAADFAIPGETLSPCGVDITVDGTAGKLWAWPNQALGDVQAGQLAFNVEITMDEHTVTIPAGTVLEGYVLAESFTFCTHADGTMTVEQTPTEPEPTTPSVTEPTEPGEIIPETVTLQESTRASGAGGFYFTVSPADSLPYSSDWTTRPVFTQGGVSLENGTLLTSERTLIKLSSNSYYVALADNHYTPTDGEIVYVDGTVETDRAKVTFSPTAFRYDGQSQTWSIVPVLTDVSAQTDSQLEIVASFFIPAQVAQKQPTISCYVDGKLQSQTVVQEEDGVYYSVAASLTAKDMTAQVMFRLTDGQSVLCEQATTLRQLAGEIIEGAYPDAYKTAAKALLNYGTAAQLYFHCRTDDLANSGYDTTLEDVSLTDIGDMTVEGEGTGYLGATLRLQDVLTARLYFDHRVEDGTDRNGYHYVEILDILPEALSQTQTVSVENTRYTFSVLSLAKQVVQGDYEEEYQNLMKALICYAKAVDTLRNSLIILSPVETVYPYGDYALEYLTAEDPNIRDYTCGTEDAHQDTMICWNEIPEATGYTVLLATKEDMSDAKTYRVDPEECAISVNNLLKDQLYYVKVTAEGTDRTATTTFRTANIGPRVMTVDGMYNVRDMGGYTTASGKTTVQGLVYRGGALTPSSDFPQVQITDTGIQTMQEEMGIVTEIDFRNVTEALGVTESCIPGAELIYCTLGGYDSGLQNYAASYKKVFEILARPENYPVYYHCTGGADRTGTVSYLLGALLGMDKADLIRDYEFTSFSLYGERNSKTTTYAFTALCDMIDGYAGDTLAEKAENYLLSIGVTADEIYNIRAIMFGEEPRDLGDLGEEEPDDGVAGFFDYMNSKTTVTLNSSKTSVTTDLAVGYGNTVRIPLDTQIVSGQAGKLLVYIGSYGINLRGGTVRFHINDGSDKELARPDGYTLASNFFDNGGYLDLTVTLKDTNVIFDIVLTNASGTTTYQYICENGRLADEIASENAKITVKIDPSQFSEAILTGQAGDTGTEEPDAGQKTFFDYMNSKTTVTLNSSNTSVTTDLAVGYGNTVRIPLDTQIVSGQPGKLLVYIGSYGINLRGGTVRFHKNDGADSEYPRPDGYTLASNFFDNGGYLDLTVTLEDTNVVFDMVLTNASETVTYRYTCENGRLADEIASENAKITVKIDPSQFSEAIITP